MQNSKISNDGLTEMTLNLYGEYGGYNATLNCNQDTFDDVCYINCLGSTACVNLRVNCFATCKVNCDIGNNIACPPGYTGPSPNPTTLPSLNPTRVPSLHPTKIPSRDRGDGVPPTVVASKETLMPTKIPTENTKEENNKK